MLRFRKRVLLSLRLTSQLTLLAVSCPPISARGTPLAWRRRHTKPQRLSDSTNLCSANLESLCRQGSFCHSKLGEAHSGPKMEACCKLLAWICLLAALNYSFGKRNGRLLVIQALHSLVRLCMLRCIEQTSERGIPLRRIYKRRAPADSRREALCS